MGLETFTYISSLNTSNPASTDQRSTADDHLRGIKTAVKASFPNVAGAVSATDVELNYCDGVTGPIQDQLKGNWRLLQTQDASSSSAITFVNGVSGAVLSSTYDAYEIMLTSVVPGTDAVNLLLRTSTNAGSSYDSGASDYRYDYQQVVSGTASAAGATTTSVIVNGATTLGSSTSEVLHGVIRIFKPSAASDLIIYSELTFINSAGNLVMVRTVGRRATAADVDAIQFSMSSGNIASGTFALYGRIK